MDIRLNAIEHSLELLENTDIFENVLKGFMNKEINGISSIQRKFAIGFPKASAIVLVLSELGYIKEDKQSKYEYDKYPDTILEAMEKEDALSLKEALKSAISNLK